MTNHKSAKRRIRQNAARRLRNRYKVVSTRTLMKKRIKTEDKAAAEKLLPKVNSKIDKCVKAHIYHKNKAARLKSQMASHVNGLG